MIPESVFLLHLFEKESAMKTIRDETHYVTQLASWKFFLYLTLSIVLLTVMYYDQSMLGTNHFIQADISDFQPVMKLINGDQKPALLFVSIVAGGLAVGSLVALIADLVTWRSLQAVVSLVTIGANQQSSMAAKHGSMVMCLIRFANKHIF